MLNSALDIQPDPSFQTIQSIADALRTKFWTHSIQTTINLITSNNRPSYTVNQCSHVHLLPAQNPATSSASSAQTELTESGDEQTCNTRSAITPEHLQRRFSCRSFCTNFLVPLELQMLLVTTNIHALQVSQLTPKIHLHPP